MLWPDLQLGLEISHGAGSFAMCLQEHAVELLYAAPGSDLVLAGTAQRQLVVWQYNPHAAHRCDKKLLPEDVAYWMARALPLPFTHTC
jgi:hypothetical protein